MKAIVAVDKNWGIGKNGNLLARNKEDMRFFTRTTKGNVVIMGRKTLESFPGQNPLKDRDNIVITKDLSYQKEGAYIVHSLEAAKEVANQCANGEKDIFVIGGESIYRQMLLDVDTMYVTKMDQGYDADTFFPDLDADENWYLAEQGEMQEYPDGQFCFCTYKRK